MDLRAAQGDDRAVRSLAQEFLATWPDNTRARAYLAGRTPVEARGADHDAYFRKGLELGNQESYVESALCYREALCLKGDSADALSNLGWTLSKLGFNRK